MLWEKMTVSFLAGIFSEEKPTSLLPYSPWKREELLQSPLVQNYLQQVTRIYGEEQGKPLVSIPFSAIRAYWEHGDRLPYTDVFCAHRRRLAVALLMAWLYGEPQHIAFLEDVLWAVCDEYTWATSADLPPDTLENERYTLDLFAAETGSTLCECLAMVGARLSPVVQKRIRILVEQRIFSRFESDSFWWEKATNNWAAVCAGSVGIAALYEIRDPQRLAVLTQKVLRCMESYVSGFCADGASDEGLSYWYYGFSYFVAYADLLVRRTNGRCDLFADPQVAPKLCRIACFAQKATFIGEGMVHFGDFNYGDTSRWWGLLSYLHRIYPAVQPLARPLLPDFDSETSYRWVRILRDLVWGDPSFLPPQTVTGHHWLPDVQWMLCSSASGHVHIAAKAGHNGVSHNHNDVGHFQFYKNGEEFFADLGAGVYTGKSFQSGSRYMLFWNASEGHSVPLVNGHTQQPGKPYTARNVSCTGTVLTADLAGAYDDPTLTSLVRVHSFEEEAGVLTVTDSFAFTQPPENMTERFVTYGKPVLTNGKVLLPGQLAVCTISYDAECWAVTVSSRSFLDHGSSKAHLPPKTVYFLDFTALSPQADGSVCFTIQ